MNNNPNILSIDEELRLIMGNLPRSMWKESTLYKNWVKAQAERKEKRQQTQKR